MAAVVEVERPSGGPEWARRYPPLFAGLVALIAILLVLPSALNLPQTNPTETLEFAPVPPEDDEDPPPDQGNFASLGLGRSSSLEGGPEPGGEGPGSAPGGTGPGEPAGKALPGNFNCVGSNPPRQTFDPLSPPCSFWPGGDNGGRTYGIGITGDEIKIVYYIDGPISYINASDPSNRTTPSGTFFDLWEKPKAGEHLTVKALRVWQAYFSARFETYNRRPHFYAYFSDCGGGCNPNSRRADAARIVNEIAPFAVISDATEGAEDDFLRALARKGVLNFGSFSVRTEAFFNDFPGKVWSYLPSVEQQVETYTRYVCTNLVGKAPVLAGGDLQARSGGKRKFGMLHTVDPNHKGLLRMAELVKQRVEACGGKIEATAQFSQCCLAQDNSNAPTDEARDMSDFQQKGITTILWPGGIQGNYAKSASGNGYFPEWVLVGDGILDAHRPIRLAQATAAFDKRAIIVSPQTLQPGVEQQRCYQAFREIDSNYPAQDLRYYTCEYYIPLFQLFVGIQAAGPKLTPKRMDAGFHAIPQKRVSTDPQVPACFYLPGDYTCVKDVQISYWDASRVAPGADEPGCWRSLNGGLRYLANEMKDGQVQIKGDEPCNGYDASVRFNLA